MNHNHENLLKEFHARDGRRDMSNLAGGASGHDIAMLLADQPGNRKRGNSVERMAERWVRSEEFVPVELPVEMLHPCRIPSGRTESRSTGPIVVEDNFRSVEQSDAGVKNGFVPPHLIIDGQHRWYAARESGQEMIHCLVGVNALPKINAELLQREFRRKK